MKKQTKTALAVGGALLALAVVPDVLPTSPQPKPRQRVLGRFKLENRDGSLVVTPMQRRVHYITNDKGERIKIELVPKSTMIEQTND